MATKATMFGVTKKSVSIPAYSVISVDYLDTAPNYFRVQNNGGGVLYCSGDHIPNNKNYDFMVKAGSMKMYAEPYNRRKLYIYNPNGSEAEAIILSFQAEFEPLTLAMSDIEISMPSEIESQQVITGFQTALPAGDNNIGNVGVTNWPTDYAKEANQKDYTQALENILARFDKMSVSTGAVDHACPFSAENETGTTNFCNGGGCRIHFLTNDGDTPIYLNFKGANDPEERSLAVKAGETIEEFCIDCSYMNVSFTNGSYRALVSWPF